MLRTHEGLTFMNSQFQIRIAVSSDAASIASVLLQSFVEFKSSYTPAGFAATAPGAEQIWARMNEGPVWVALHKDEGGGRS